MTILFFQHTNGLWIVNAWCNRTFERLAGGKFLYVEQAERFKESLENKA